jgi:hypothetical protein
MPPDFSVSLWHPVQYCDNEGATTCARAIAVHAKMKPPIITMRFFNLFSRKQLTQRP